MRFKRQEIPEDMDEYEFKIGDGLETIAQLLKASGLVGSTSEAMRMIKQGAVKIDGVKIEDAKQRIVVSSLFDDRFVSYSENASSLLDFFIAIYPILDVLSFCKPI